MTGPLRVAIVSNGNFFATRMIEPVLSSLSMTPVGVIVVSTPPGRHGRAATLASLASRTGLRFAAFKAVSLVVPKLASLLERRALTLVGVSRQLGLPVRELRSVNELSATTWLRSLEPDVLLSVSSPERFSPEVLRIPRVAAVNLHWALLPRFGGIAPYFWQLREGDDEAGLTIHLMVEELDAGAVLGSRALAIRAQDTALGLQLRLTRAGRDELVTALEELPGSLERAEPQRPGGRSYHSWPTREDVRVLRRRGRRLARVGDVLDLWRYAREAARRG